MIDQEKDEVEKSLAKPKNFLIRDARNGLVGYLVLNGREPIQVTNNQHGFLVISEAQVARFNPLTWALTFSEKP